MRPRYHLSSRKSGHPVAPPCDRPNTLTPWIKLPFLYAFILAGAVGFVAGFIHSGPAIFVYPLLAWSPFLVFIIVHQILAAPTRQERLNRLLYIVYAMVSAALTVFWIRWT